MICQHDPMLEDCTLKLFASGTGAVEIFCTECQCCTKELLRPESEFKKLLVTALRT